MTAFLIVKNYHKNIQEIKQSVSKNRKEQYNSKFLKQKQGSNIPDSSKN